MAFSEAGRQTASEASLWLLNAFTEAVANHLGYSVNWGGHIKKPPPLIIINEGSHFNMTASVNNY